jgi:hypothetical protein
MTVTRTGLRFLAAIILALASAVMPARSQSPDTSGISVDRYRRMFPPAPVEVRAEMRNNRPLISWREPPAPPSGQIGYDPAVESYRVYRVDAALNRTLLGETTSLSFDDSTPLLAGGVRHYAVTAVQRSGVESGMSQQAELRGPGKP